MASLSSPPGNSSVASLLMKLCDLRRGPTTLKSLLPARVPKHSVRNTRHSLLIESQSVCDLLPLVTCFAANFLTRRSI